MDCSDSPPLQILDLSTPYSSAFTSFCRSSAGAAACAVTMLISAAPWRAGYDPVALGATEARSWAGRLRRIFTDGSDRAALPIAWNHNASMSRITGAAAGASESRYGCCTANVVDNAASRGRFEDMLLLVIEWAQLQLHSRVVRRPAPASRSGLFFAAGYLAFSPKTAPVVGLTWWIWRQAGQVTGT